MMAKMPMVAMKEQIEISSKTVINIGFSSFP